MSMTPTAQIDHLVVLAASLAQGVAWCEATLGLTPGPGGQHPLMGTHNRLLRLASPRFPRSYFEIIAIDPDRSLDPARRRRWFDMDDAALQERVARHGPQLAHVVARVPDVRAAVAAWSARGIDRGEVLEANRMTPTGMLRWQITVRPDGQRLFGGVLPTLIEWGESHPADTLPEAGVVLESLAVTHPEAASLQTAFDAIGLALAVSPGPASLAATLDTPRGRLRLDSAAP